MSNCRRCGSDVSVDLEDVAHDLPVLCHSCGEYDALDTAALLRFVASELIELKEKLGVE